MSDVLNQILFSCCFMALSVIVIPLVLIYELILSPISIPCYYIRRNNHNKWLAKWKSNLSKCEINAVEKHIGGPISIYEFRKYAVSSFEMRLGIVYTDIPQHIPSIFLRPINIPCSYSPCESEFIDSLNYMLKCLNIKDLEKNINSRENRILRAMLTDMKECAICRDDHNLLNIENSRMLECAHVFHDICIEKAIKIKQECPLCRDIV